MVVAKIYKNKPKYFNKFGERIQEWDSYGKKKATTVTYEKVQIDEIYASDEESAKRRADYIYNDYFLEFEERE